MHLNDNTILQGGKYRIVRFISSGGFGCTYEGVHTMMNSRVAIKEFFVSSYCSRDTTSGTVTVTNQSQTELIGKLSKRFVDEARAVYEMNHPNIVRVKDFFEENGTAYYVMDYIDGMSLNELVKKHGAMPEATALGYIRQVADALKYVHSQNRLHLDVKPANIMVDKTGKAILIDFGASKHYDPETHEQTSTLLGINTRGYAPTEQMSRTFTDFNAATDIYSLGATLYKLLTGNTPPDSVSLLNEEETLKPMPANISASTRQAVLKAMEPKRKNRPQSIDEFLAILDGKAGAAHNTGQDKTEIIGAVPPPPAQPLNIYGNNGGGNYGDSGNGGNYGGPGNGGMYGFPDNNNKKKNRTLFLIIAGVVIVLLIAIPLIFTKGCSNQAESYDSDSVRWIDTPSYVDTDSAIPVEEEVEEANAEEAPYIESRASKYNDYGPTEYEEGIDSVALL